MTEFQNSQKYATEDSVTQIYVSKAERENILYIKCILKI